MVSFLNFNGNIIPENSPSVSAQNQNTQVGVFETMKYSQGKIKNFEDHFTRLFKGIYLLKINVPLHFTSSFFEQEIFKLLKTCNYNFARIRLSVLETPEENQKETINFIIETRPLVPETGTWQISIFTTSIYKEHRIMANDFSAIKHNNRLPYSMAQKFSRKNNYNDVFLLNQYGRVCDSTIANIFLIKSNIIYTPLIEEGCIDGIMRKNIIQILTSSGHRINEIPVEVKNLAEADEIFITNSIINMKPVSDFNGKPLKNSFSHTLFNEIKQNSDLFD